MFRESTIGADSTKKNICILSTNEQNTRLLEIILKKDYNISVESSPYSALQNIFNNPKKYDLVIADVAIPEMSGIEFALNLKEIFETNKTPENMPAMIYLSSIPKAALHKKDQQYLNTINPQGFILVPQPLSYIKNTIDSLVKYEPKNIPAKNAGTYNICSQL